MVKTFEEAKDESRSEDDDRESPMSGNEYGVFTTATYGGKTLEGMVEDTKNLVIPTPSGLGDEKTDTGLDDINERTDNLRDQIDIDFSAIEEALGEIESSIEDQGELNLGELNNTELFQLMVQRLGEISQTSVQRTKVIQVLADTQVQSLSTLISLYENNRPMRALTVSGTVAIEEANEPQTIIDGADATDIPTKTLWVRSDPRNNSKIFLGDDEVEPNQGYVILPGEAITVEINFADEQLYMASPDESQIIQLMGWI